MAITLSSQPDAISPVFSDNKFIMSESGASYFTLVFSGDVSGTFKIYPNSLGDATFNARYHLESYIYSQIALPTQTELPDGIKSYTLTITSDLASTITVSNMRFFNSALQDREVNKASNGFILNNVYSDSNELVSAFNGVDSYLQFDDLTGVNIIRYEGTSILTIDYTLNTIVGTAGTCYNLLLSNGEFYASLMTGDSEIITFEAAFNEVLNFSAPLNFNDVMNF